MDLVMSANRFANFYNDTKTSVHVLNAVKLET